MKLLFDRLQLNPLLGNLSRSIASSLFVLIACPPASFAGQPTLTAIELYDGPNGAAYVQLSDVLINGKATLRDCTPFQATGVDKSSYGKMQKVTLSPGAVLERNEDGVLRYETGSGPAVCSLPDNLKIDRSGSYTLSGLADLATVTGTALSPSGVEGAAPQPLQKGVKLYFVAAPDQELAEFLRAQRANNVAGWVSYLSRYPAVTHATDAKHSLGALYVTSGEASIASYLSSVATRAPSYSDLMNAKIQTDNALALQLPPEQTTKLSSEVRKEVATLADNGRNELNAYKLALQAHTPGYAHLKQARELANAVSAIDLNFPTGQALLADVLNASNQFDRTLRSAESAVTAGNFDSALELVAPIRAFSSEEPRIAAVTDAAYDNDLDRANQFAEKADWKNAVIQIEKAAAVKETPQTRDLMVEARKQLVDLENKTAVAKALESSLALEQQHDNIGALDVLYNLPPSQRALVAADIDRLKDGYVQSAVQAAKDLQKAHEPLRGLGDEIGIEKAYNYLLRAFELSQDDSYRDMSEILGDDLSTYFVSQAKLYLDKPSGSGTEIGWAYLEEALFYEPSNQAAHDAKVAAALAHAMHAGPSIRVQFRDQTSLRDSTGFLHQLEDAIVAGLEMPNVKAVRDEEAVNGLEPDFQLVGDVLEHQISESVTVDALESQYRIGTHEVTGEEWNTANRAYETALRTLQTDQSALTGAQSKGKKKEIKDLNAKIDADQKQVTDAQTIADSLPKTVISDVIRPYQYSRKTLDISNTIKLQFRIGETLSSRMGDPVIVAKEDPRQYVLIEDVKAEDTQGVKPTGTTPDTKELQTALENSVRDELIDAVRSKVKDLPDRIYATAKSKEQDDNLDGAAEAYLRFLSCANSDESTERQHASSFLAEHFNFQPAEAASQ
jgi:hypothetical protein